MKNLIYILLVSLCIACDDGICDSTYTFTDSEKDFITYKLNDSILIKYNNNTDSTANWQTTFEATYYENRVVKDYEVFGTDFCEEHYEREIVHFYPKEYSIFENYYDYIEYIGLETSRQNNEFNLGIAYYFDTTYLTFGSTPFINSNSTIFFNSSKVLDSKTYENVYTLLSNYDTLYYSPNYGCIKLITESGIYTFENLN